MEETETGVPQGKPPGRSRRRLVTMTVLAGAVLATGVAGAVAAARQEAPPATKVRREVQVMRAPNTYYLPLAGGAARPPAFDHAFAAGGSGSDEERTLKNVRAVFDLSGLRGKAGLRSVSAACKADGHLVTCPLADFYQRTELTPFQLETAPGAKKGESGSVRLTVTSSNAPAVRHTTRVVVGAPELTTRRFAPREKLTPGSELAFTPAFGNKGEVPLDEGVSLQVVAQGATLEARYDNCRYDRLDAPTRAQCDFPAGLPAGAAFEVADAFRATIGTTATSGSLSAQVWEIGDPPEYAGLGGDAPHGTGATLRLRPVDGSGFGTGGAHLAFRTTQTTDRKAVGFTIKGRTGEVVTTQVPSPGRLTLPEGTTLVPLGPGEQDEALYCAHEKGGEQERRAECPQGPDGFGTKLRVRIDRRVEGARGSITVPYDPAEDPDEENNTAPVLMEYTDAP
ncbi:hypothetical protein [Streptomyces sp. NPDC007100]|uniref:hypothetical protein n=1 Tax=Streptomyces sp. NPDC007100 TaxID=3155602 RepID=UPI0033EA48DC